ncbi:MAG TPA: F0F1 ATP synthase subunit A [Kiritimatiellia bacterium]|nr:F0F1 ATP synthase subunit A [Kiritimatiellia bacterium]
MSTGNQEAVSQFINHHVMHHAGSLDAWNLPFFRIDALEWFRYDAVMVFVVGALLIATAWAVRRSHTAIPKGLAAVAEAYVVFIRDHIVRPNFGNRVSHGTLSFFCTLFIFILCANVLGLIPLFSTATGNVNVTAGLATIFMAASLATVVQANGWRGIKAAFVPGGLPGWLKPVMAFMEVVSFVSRAFALTMRLFCNMLAGHIVIYSLLGVIAMFSLMAAPMLVVTVGMYVFELFVAFLQAYVFTLLSSIFMGMMVNPEH